MKATRVPALCLAFVSFMLAGQSAYADEDKLALRIGATRAALGTNWKVGDAGDIMRLDGCRKKVLSPTLGIRYFADEHLGFEVNMALPRFASDTFNSATPDGRPVSMGTKFPHFWVWGIGFSGLWRPRLLHTERFSIVVVPDVNFTIAGGKDVAASGSAYSFSLKYLGTRADAGARLAAEFGPFGPVAIQLNAGYYVGWQYLSTTGTDVANKQFVFRTNQVWYRVFIKDNILDAVNAAILFYFPM